MAARKRAATKKAAEVYVATETGSVDIKGQNYVFYRDVTRVAADHPLIKACPDFFAPAEDRLHYGGVEQATAAPGEKRGE
jgi:hypothetical protein